ncbi:unnamed protein product [Phaedon cochleariae]|uniref:Cyclic nucleotide-binding domain-containing protein n=1 Tax=Phaedon cochleariae TaxID=80249 RepID=A0A9P0DR44_PHACE|nr:unnamed protein product [Phaedon cochleariae]
MHISCSLEASSSRHRANSNLGDPLGCCQKWRRKLQDLILISANNPLCLRYFRSETSIRGEKRRQLHSKHPWVIHPLSKFRAWYEVFLVFVHMMNLFGKPIDAGFARGQYPLYWGHRQVSIILDVLCWIDILMNFSTGFVKGTSRKIEMDPKQIARNYVLGPFFILDLLSSFPRNLPYFIMKKPFKPLLGMINIFLSLRCFRIMTLMSLIYRISQYFEINKSKGLIFLFCSILITMIVIHWLACFQHIVPRLTGRYFVTIPFEESWIYQDGIYELDLRDKYRHAFFKASSEILGIRLQYYRMTITVDYVVAIITYILGKILMVSIWIILAVAILNSRSMEIKFEEIINQLSEYMKQKQLPFNLMSRISQYYNFKYQKKYFKEKMITDLLSEHLREEVNLHVCKSLISSVGIFGELTPDQLSSVVAKLIPEIFLPKDTIVQSGSTSDSMFFLSSGTVAVYTHSGKEMCHLQDGEYFGEVCLILRNQSAICTIVAIEITQVYRLRKRDFERTLMKNKSVYNKILHLAEIRLKLIHQAEETYKRELFEKSFQIDPATKSTTPIEEL